MKQTENLEGIMMAPADKRRSYESAVVTYEHNINLMAHKSGGEDIVQTVETLDMSECGITYGSNKTIS